MPGPQMTDPGIEPRPTISASGTLTTKAKMGVQQWSNNKCGKRLWWPIMGMIALPIETLSRWMLQLTLAHYEGSVFYSEAGEDGNLSVI